MADLDRLRGQVAQLEVLADQGHLIARTALRQIRAMVSFNAAELVTRQLEVADAALADPDATVHGAPTYRDRSLER